MNERTVKLMLRDLDKRRTGPASVLSCDRSCFDRTALTCPSCKDEGNYSTSSENLRAVAQGSPIVVLCGYIVFTYDSIALSLN